MALTVLLVGGVGAWGLHEYGPRFGVYVVPPSPQRYAEIAVDFLDTGYYAEGAEWAAARSALLDAAATASGYEELYPLIETATRAAGGKHSAFRNPDAVTTHDDPSEVTMPTVSVSDGMGTVVLPELLDPSERTQQEYADAAASGIAAHADEVCGWIVDVRGNGGGNMYPMLSGIAAFLPNGTALSFRGRSGDEQTRVTVQDDGAGLNGQTVVTVDASKTDAGAPIALVQDAGTGSSAEAVVAAFRGVDGVRSFGASTAGYTSANLPRALPDGASIVLTQSVYVDRDGTAYPEVGIDPDEATDDAEAAALAWMQSQGCR